MLSMAAVGVVAGQAVAGMPSALTEDFRLVFRLNESPRERLQVISFFLLGIAVSSWIVQALWNSLSRDFPRLPRLTYGKAFAVVVLWGLLFIVVLTMISGARELMTPGAWNKSGLTYSLDDGHGANSENASEWPTTPLERSESTTRPKGQRP